MNKKLNDLTEEELLSVLEGSTVKVHAAPNDILEFVDFYKLQPGEEKVTGKLLYNLYLKWSKNPVSKMTFHVTMYELFPRYRNNNLQIFLLNLNAINLKQETFKFLNIPDETKKKWRKEHFDEYLYYYNLKSGRLFLKDIILYKLYKLWCSKTRKTRPLGFRQFINFCKLYFRKHKLIKRHYWFAVNTQVKSHLTEDMIKEMSSTNAPKKEDKKIPS